MVITPIANSAKRLYVEYIKAMPGSETSEKKLAEEDSCEAKIAQNYKKPAEKFAKPGPESES